MHRRWPPLRQRGSAPAGQLTPADAHLCLQTRLTNESAAKPGRSGSVTEALSIR